MTQDATTLNPVTPAPRRTIDQATPWASWHLHLGSPDRNLHDRVVSEVVMPVVASAGDRPWFFLRYWQAGPHIRFRIGGLDATCAAAVTDDLQTRLTLVGPLRDGEESLDEATYRQGAVRAAYGESGTDSVVQDLRPPGVYLGSYEPEVERYGGARHMADSEQVFRLSSELVAAFLRHRPSPAARAGLAVRGTAAAAAAVGGVTGQSGFSAYGLRSLRALAQGQGYPADQLDEWCRVSGRAGLDPEAHGPLVQWRTALTGLAATLATTWNGSAQAHPGAVLASHVHMLHNRLGLSLLEEMRTYAWLGATSSGAPSPRPGGGTRGVG